MYDVRLLYVVCGSCVCRMRGMCGISGVCMKGGMCKMFYFLDLLWICY